MQSREIIKDLITEFEDAVIGVTIAIEQEQPQDRIKLRMEEQKKAYELLLDSILGNEK